MVVYNTRQHVIRVARNAILVDNVLVIADTNVWFDYFKPVHGTVRDTDYIRERQYLNRMIKSGKIRLPKLIRDEVVRAYKGKYRLYMNNIMMPAPAEFNAMLKNKLDKVPVIRQDKRHSLPKVEKMYGRIWRRKGLYKKEMYRWGSSKSRDADGNPNWHYLNAAGKIAFLLSAREPSKTDKAILAIAAHRKAVQRGTYVILFTRDADFLAFSRIIYKKFGVVVVSPHEIFPAP